MNKLSNILSLQDNYAIMNSNQYSIFGGIYRDEVIDHEIDEE